MIRKTALFLARQAWLRKTILATPVLRELAGRFVGGDDLASGASAVRTLNARGIRGSLNFHGMHALEPGEAVRAGDEAIAALRLIRDQGLEANISIKLTKLGLDVDPALCLAQLHRVLEAAADTGGFAWIDAEEARYLDFTHRTFNEMADRYGTGTVGLVVQSYLRNRSGDLGLLMARGARIRLVKGGYREAEALVYRSKAEVDAAFRLDIERLLARGSSPAIATHDAEAVAWACQVQARLGLGADAFEFQMLHGVRPELQARLVAEGYRVRCYIPYGGDWATHLVGCLRRIPAGALSRLVRPAPGPARS